MEAGAQNDATFGPSTCRSLGKLGIASRTARWLNSARVGVNAWRGWLPSGNDGKGHLHDRVSISVLGVIERRHGPSER